ncbi:hypothetical protein [Deinococcus radiotolerans]|uniref:Uncharacterized protein n=1 Tax=Deinococcus radiotolerans TaxID=1309407 RepID=A0ABQ2FDN6_9DEIO|nr:hypothetical protein [Deinococcus radiotolerans]GGK88004.1 hypothetical protein GCM10010844_03250 [Deinococcus radiotolerans]
MSATQLTARLKGPLLGAVLITLLSSCLPAPSGPSLTSLRLVPEQGWSTQDLLDRSELPASRVRPLAEALRQAPVGSVLVACEFAAALWGPCRHLTRKISEDTVAEEPGWFGRGATERPLTSLLRRDLALVVTTGVRPEQIPALRREVQRLWAAPYLLNGTLNAFDCGTYQNALQRAVGLPDAVPLDARWGAYLPSGTLSVPTNTFLFAGASDRLMHRLMDPPVPAP